ncbi:hypothetical protein BH20PSE1_BH20PSE1_14570 [soil metagenome]
MATRAQHVNSHSAMGRALAGSGVKGAPDALAAPRVFCPISTYATVVRSKDAIIHDTSAPAKPIAPRTREEGYTDTIGTFSRGRRGGVLLAPRNDPASKPRHGAGSVEQPAVAVVTSGVRKGPANQRVESVATLLADEAVVIRSEIDGRVGVLDVQEGQPIGKGHVLVTLDPAEYRAEVDQREAGLELGELKFKRARDLLAKRVMSKQEYDEMDAALKEARAALALARARLNKTVLRAPFSGILGLRQISPGDYVKKGRDLVNLEAIDPIKIDLRIPERHAAQVRPSQRILVQVEAATPVGCFGNSPWRYPRP